MGKKIDKVQELESKINELEALLKRAVADYHNLEKRVVEGRSELTKWGTGELLIKLLPVLDHLEQAMGGVSEQEKQSGWLKGVELAVKEFKNVLQSEGLDEVNANMESIFDPSRHEAVDTGEGPLNMILKVVRKGYNLNGKILRPAQVIVGKNTDSGQVNSPQNGPRTTEEEKQDG